MIANREIKIYGTLLNATVNSAIGDAEHNDAFGYAYLLYDDKFGDPDANVNNFQDIINKRLTAISYANGVTTIKNRSGVPDGVPYMFIVEGASHLNGNNKISGDSIITGDTSIGGNLSVSRNQTIAGSLDVSGAATFANGATISNGNLDVARGDFSVSTGNATIAQDLSVGDDLTVGDKTNIGGTLDVVGPTTMSILSTSGGTTVGGNLTVNGITNLRSNLNVDGSTTLKNVTTDDINAKAILASGGLIVTGDTRINDGNLTVNNGDFGVTGDATVGGQLNVSNGATVNGNTTLGGPLTVTGASTFRSPVTVNSNLSVSGTGTFGGNVTAPNITTLRHDVDIINGDKNTQGSIKKAIDDLYQLLMGGSSGQHIDYDTLNELANFVVEHEEFAEALEALAQLNKADIINLRAKDTVLEGRIATNANDIQDLKDSVLHVGADIENHEDRITDLETETAAIDGRLSTLEGWADLVNLDEIPILRDEVASLRSRVSSVETSISNINTTLGSINTTIGNMLQQITNLSNALDGKASAQSVTDLSNQVSALAGAQYWALDGNTVYAKDSRSVRGAGFYDSTV